MAWHDDAMIIAGEALIDLVAGPAGRGEASLGGAPFNTARAASRLGADVEFVGVLSRDRFGTMLGDQLVADGVGIGTAPRTELPTTLAVAELDDSGAATYHFYIDGTSAPMLDQAPSWGDPAPEVLFAGGLGLVLEPMADTLAELIVGSESGMLVMIDVNCRPRVIADRAVYLTRLRSVLRRADIVKVSDDDLAYLSPERSVLDAARDVQALGPAAVLVTAGSRSTWIVTKGGAVEVPVPALRASVVDTIGAGDTFAGGLLAWWSERGLTRSDISVDVLTAAVGAAHAAAAIVVTRRGADPPTRADLGDAWTGRSAG